MSQDRARKSHLIALHSSLFRGREDLYFCFIKAEKIAHVLMVLAQRTPRGQGLEEVVLLAQKLPTTVLSFVSGGVSREVVLASLFALISRIRLCVTAKTMGENNSDILTDEIERLAEKLSPEKHLSPLSHQDLETPLKEGVIGASLTSPGALKDIHKGHNKRQAGNRTTQGQGSRAALILEVIAKEGRPLSIKDIARAVKGYSEKTVQRELLWLVAQGRLKKEGERRWSLYRLA